MIERPRSLFGKHPFLVEQNLVLNLMREVDVATFYVDPRLTEVAGIEVIPVEKILTPEERRRKALKHLERAKRILEEIGV